MKRIQKTIVIGGGVFVLSCIGLAAAVISDLEWLKVLCAMTGTLALVILPFGIIAALCMRKFVTGLVGIGVFALSMLVGFFTFILIGAGQHHPPKHDGEEVVPSDTCMVTDVEAEEP